MGYNVAIEYRQPVALIDVRGKYDQMKKVLVESGLDLPNAPHSQLGSSSYTVFRAGRNWCIVIAGMDRESELLDNLERHCQNISVQCTCVTDAYRGIDIVGPDVNEVLSQVIPINLHEFEVDSATFTELFGLRGFVIRRASNHYTVYPDRSYADYTMKRMLKCALHQFDEQQESNG